MSGEAIPCVKCGRPMGEREWTFVDNEPWHVECHYRVVLAERDAARRLIREAARQDRDQYWLSKQWHKEAAKQAGEA